MITKKINKIEEQETKKGKEKGKGKEESYNIFYKLALFHIETFINLKKYKTAAA